MNPNIKTTIAGIVGGLAVLLQGIYNSSPEPIMIGPVSIGALATGLLAFAVAWGFNQARDRDITSEGTKIPKK